jgi:hypothetical protein
MAEGDRFVDNGDGTVTDTKYNKMWMKEDSWQMRGKWLTWKAAHKFVAWLNEQNFAGYDDWRVPKNQECRNLYDHECKNTDFAGDIVHIDYIFPEGCGSTLWCNEEQGINGLAYNFYSDRGYQVRKKSSDEGNMGCRPIRSSGPEKKIQGRLSATGRSRRGD